MIMNDTEDVKSFAKHFKERAEELYAENQILIKEIDDLNKKLDKWSICFGNINRLAVKYAPECNGTPLDEVMEYLLAHCGAVNTRTEKH